MKCFVIRTITGAMGVVSKGLKSLETNQGDIQQILYKKIALLGT